MVWDYWNFIAGARAHRHNHQDCANSKIYSRAMAPVVLCILDILVLSLSRSNHSGGSNIDELARIPFNDSFRNKARASAASKSCYLYTRGDIQHSNPAYNCASDGWFTRGISSCLWPYIGRWHASKPGAVRSGGSPNTRGKMELVDRKFSRQLAEQIPNNYWHCSFLYTLAISVLIGSVRAFCKRVENYCYRYALSCYEFHCAACNPIRKAWLRYPPIWPGSSGAGLAACAISSRSIDDCSGYGSRRHCLMSDTSAELFGQL